MKKIDLDKWYRKDFYQYYKSFQSPLYGTTIEVDVTKSYTYCKENHCSFFLFCLYVFLRASNEVKEFRYREVDDKVYDMEHLSASTPIMKKEDNNQFSSIELDLKENFDVFSKYAEDIIDNMTEDKNVPSNNEDDKGIIFLSYQSWFSFQSMFFPKYTTHQSTPVLAWSKFREAENKKIMPYALQVNHMFIDGYHLGEFINKVEYYFLNPSKV